MLEDAFRFQLFKAADGGLVIKSSMGDGNQTVELTAYMQRWTSKEITLKLGVTSAAKVFEGAMFKWPRMPAARYIWSLKSVYRELHFQQFGGQQWRWADSGWRRWKKMLEQEYQLGEHLVPSGQSKARVVASDFIVLGGRGLLGLCRRHMLEASLLCGLHAGNGECVVLVS